MARTKIQEGITRTHGRKRVRIETPEQHMARLERARRAAALKKANAAANGVVHPFVAKLKALAKKNNDKACLEYFKIFKGSHLQALRPDDFIQNPCPYVGREHIDVGKVGKDWLGPMAAYLEFRQAKGYETAAIVRQSLHILCDYLFLYLPWWIEMHPEAALTAPTAPKDFIRFVYVTRTRFSDEPVSAVGTILPATLYQLIELRRPARASFNMVIVALDGFFQFVRTTYESVDRIAGLRMQSPIHLFYDKKKAPRPGKTNKVPFDEEVFPHLVHFCQAAEAFGEFLMQRAYEEDIFVDNAIGKRYGYDTAEAGYMPFIVYRGKLYPVRWMPDVYPMSKRRMRMNPPSPAGIYIGGRRINAGRDITLERRFPQLAIVRLLLGLVETGLRGQGIQWLDRTRWDSLNPNPSAIGELYSGTPTERFTKMLVNTDKTKPAPWTTFIPWRVRRAFLAERYFQESVATKWVDAIVDYEGRPHSRFEPIVPLFRSHSGKNPCSDSFYADYWRQLLLGFQVYYNSRVGYSSAFPDGLAVELESPAEFFIATPQLEADEATVTVIKSKDGSYCPVSFVMVSPPHTCRATYATLRDGDMDVSDIALQLGHANTVVTQFYTVVKERKLKRKLEEAEERLMGYDATGKSPANLHPEHPSSRVRQAFAKNREVALDTFGFVNGVSFWSTSDLLDEAEDALTLLRESPASVIAWHPTHACPVGNQCPSDIVPKIGGLHRCGLCPLAAKCIDHLPGIGAKKNHLKEQIRTYAKRIVKLETEGADGELLKQLHKRMELDAKELMGWELAEQILIDRAERLSANEQAQYHVDAPDLVRLHIRRVVRNSTESEFFLQRIAESNAYPSMESPEVRARAARYVRAILARAGKLEEAATLEIEPFHELDLFASLVRPMTQAKGFTIDELNRAIQPAAARPKLPVVSPHPLLERTSEGI